jgi:AmmeMemoRadiSam system protein B
MFMDKNVLTSALAGSWYPDNPVYLEHEIDAFLEAATTVPLDDVIALLLPHAGYRYSGLVAAHGIKQVVGCSYERVVVMGPSHHFPMFNEVSIPDVSHIETPLGLIEIDRDLVERLWKHPEFQSHSSAHAAEHSVQIELPLLQRALGSFKLVPIVCGELDESGMRRIAAVLLEHIGSETLVVVSSDFTHYGHAFDYVPFRDNIKENLQRLDMGAFGFFEEKDLPGFLQYLRDTGITICGRSPMSILISMLPDEARVDLLKYQTSGDLTDDWSHCVSYVSSAVSGQWGALRSGAETHESNRVLSAEEKSALLHLARHKIACRLKKDESEPDIKITPSMKSFMGAFVTLHKQGGLRGCIGEIFPRRALVEAIAEQAVNAAFHDPRFPPLREDELGDVDIEISALTEPHPVKSYEDIVVGTHGRWLRNRGGI